MYSPLDIHASHSRSQDDGKEPTMPATSGPTSGQPFATYDPESRSWKTSPGTDPLDSTEYSETWPRTGSMRSGRAYEHPTSGRRTGANGYSSSLLPTPLSRDHKGRNQRNDATCLAGAIDRL